ncbi:MAG: response regulator [Burkholderiales bacterium]|nr:response regulator [Burkholderiales bacterium]
MKRTILVVEDNERNRKLLRTILRFRGFEVVECDDGAPALELARKHKPSLILMDIQLPTMDGITALGQLRADAATRDIPVVAVTASVTPNERETVMAAGFNAYIGKPIDVDAFGEIVDRFVPREAKA